MPDQTLNPSLTTRLCSFRLPDKTEHLSLQGRAGQLERAGKTVEAQGHIFAFGDL